MSTLDQRARALYDACPTVKPDWEQLGDVTRGVWRERAQRAESAEQAPQRRRLPEPTVLRRRLP